MPATVYPFPPTTVAMPLEDLDVDEFERREHALLAHATSDHLPAELAETICRLRARRLTLQGLGV